MKTEDYYGFKIHRESLEWWKQVKLGCVKISPEQMIIVSIVQDSDGNKINNRILMDRLGTNMSSNSTALKGLKIKGLIAITRSEHDSRHTIVSLTESGIAIAERIKASFLKADNFIKNAVH